MKSKVFFSAPMSGKSIAPLLALAFLGSGLGCDDGDRARGLDDPLDLANGDVDAGTSDAGAVDPGSDAGVIDPSGDGGLAGDADVPPCGNAQLDPDEECDPALPNAFSCISRGFDNGLLSCTAECTWSLENCSGTEICADGRDNDGDGLEDCADSADCAAACADACAAPIPLPLNSSVIGTSVGHAAVLGASCSDAAPSGAEVVYRLDTTEAGKLDVFLSSVQAASLSVRLDCSDAESEIACGHDTRLTLNVAAGRTFFVVVDGAAASEAGDYLLEVTARQQACGDGIRDTGEACDDGNINDGDGCSPDCVVESSESEPNDARQDAETIDFNRWFAELSPAGDVDFYAVTLSAPSSTLVVETTNFGDGACGFNLMDSLVDIYDTDANDNVLIVSDDDSGDGKCARAIATGLPPGTYYVRVAAGDGAQPDTFPYRLDVSVGVCGDGDVTLGEECDDQNDDPGDGCDSQCRNEVVQ